VTVLAVFDIDGTVADTRHRGHHLECTPKNWDAFFDACGDDTPLAEGLALAAHHAYAGDDIVYLTGRPERIRGLTQAWLSGCGFPDGQLLMRRDLDRRPATTYKVQAVSKLRQQHGISLYVDDDASVVRMVRALGIPVRLVDWQPA